nr:MAG TPA: Hg(II)(GRAND CoilSerL12AL16C)3- Novo Three-stranded Helical Coiled.93A [Caudoviricetes sp.]
MKKNKTLMICLIISIFIGLFFAVTQTFVAIFLSKQLQLYKRLYLGDIHYNSLIRERTFDFIVTMLCVIFCLIVSGVLIYLLIKMLFSDKLKAARNQKVETRAERKRQALEKKKEAIDKKLSAVEKKEE